MTKLLHPDWSRGVRFISYVRFNLLVRLTARAILAQFSNITCSVNP